MRRVSVLLWTSATAAAIFLGSAWESAGSARSRPADAIVFAFSLVGFLAATAVAGRIVIVVGRTRRSRR